MNKLVSRNPVQRFKEGRKIVKAQDGTDIKKWGTYAGIPDQVSNFEYQRQYPNDIAIGLGMFKDPNNGNIYSTRVDDADRFIMVSNSIPSKKEISLPQGIGQLVKNQKDSQKNSKNSSPSKGRTSLINNRWVQGVKRRNNITDVRATQQMLKNAGFDIGKFGVDGKWGKDTEAAYQKYLISNAAKTPSLEDTISAAQNQPVLNTPTINSSEYTFTESQLPGLGENPYYESHPELRTNNLNRSDVRNWIRNNVGGSAYQVTGAQRKALRNILNGVGTDDDKKLVGLSGNLVNILTNLGYLKNGGNMLPSRNIVERFKSQRIRK